MVLGRIVGIVMILVGLAMLLAAYNILDNPTNFFLVVFGTILALGGVGKLIGG